MLCAPQPEYIVMWQKRKKNLNAEQIDTIFQNIDVTYYYNSIVFVRIDVLSMCR